MSEIHTIAVDSEKVILQLSTQENAGNAVKSSYTQSYPLYPHFFVWTTVIYITKKETNVLRISDKSLFRQKECGKPIDFFVVK